MNKKNIKWTISVIAIILTLIHIIFPKLNIDLITVFLLALAIIPWLESLFKSVELPGGLKFEFQDLERIELEAKEAGLINNEVSEKEEKDVYNYDYPFIELAKTNQSLALVSLRIEIEKRLRLIAEKYSVDANRNSMSRILMILSQKGILSQQEDSTIRDMIYTLNQAAHGVDFDERTAEWIIENGPQIVYSLENKINSRGGQFSHDNPESTEHWIDVSYENQDWNTNLEWSEHIGKHQNLWETEIKNLCDSIIKKLNDSEKIESFKKTQEHWTNQIELEREFLYTIDNFDSKVGREGIMIMLITFMNKYRQRALELEEIVNLLG
ncbi:hypothetical protein [Flavobacterium sp. WC2430]|uniref:hypothetical protein n=1 Tax=Flavobacterium sp. WC2430 TaxID=3234137 RepID=UPI0034660FFC